MLTFCIKKILPLNPPADPLWFNINLVIYWWGLVACWHDLLGGPSCALGPIPTPQGGATSLFLYQNTGEPMPNFC